ncbi:MAG: penicillin-binding protein 2 [Chlamydiia bacterium]|nr:penicillin-binding protein 2 [Chlamydiia bacterium]
MQQRPVGQRDRKRLLYLGIFIVALFSLLIAQFYNIQIVEGDKWVAQARKQHFFSVTEPFMRGTFFSNTSIKRAHPESPQRFVVDIQKFHLHADPQSIPEQYRNEIADALMNKLTLTASEQLNFRSHFDRKSRNRKLAMWLDHEKQEELLKWWRPYARARKIPNNALFFVKDYQRSYPFGKLLGQVLHTIQINKDEATKQAVPTGGLEYYFHPQLKGKEGKRLLMRSPRHSFETGEVIMPPEHGADVYLTINHVLQAICEEEVMKGVNHCQAKSGWAVMMDPRTGEILALAQYPFFYPPDYQYYFNHVDQICDTRVKAVTDANEPASVMKAFTAAIALLANDELVARGEAPLFDPDAKMPASDGTFPGRSRPIRDTRVHRYINLDMAIQKSSNIYMARLMEKVVNRLGNQWYRDKLHQVFGFGKKTGIELPAESAGVVPSPGKTYPNGKLEWSVPTPFSLAIGHNLQANSLQVLRAFAIFANGGYLVQPTLVRKIVKSDDHGKEHVLVDHTDWSWIGKFPRILPQSVVDRVVKSLKYVTKPGGGGFRGEVWGYSEAGKTGTAKKIVDGQYSNKKYCASFVGFTPVDDPAFVLMVVMDEPSIRYREGIGHMYYGSLSAAPVFRTIAQRALEYLGVAPDDPTGYPKNDYRYDGDKADWINETRQLQEKYEKWNKE